MNTQQIKWMIFIVPALVIGLWEFIRHEWLLPYISMELGNWMTPLIVLLFSVFINYKLFQILERNQHELEQEKMKQAIINERQEISRELHDSISQSLFLLSVKIDQLEKNNEPQTYEQIQLTIDRLQENVRHSIKQLRTPNITNWKSAIQSTIEQLNSEKPEVEFYLDWQASESSFSSEEKVQFFWIIREAIMNILKHAKNVTRVTINASPKEIKVIDNGTEPSSFDKHGSHYGIEMMQDRAQSVGWKLTINRENEQTILRLARKEEAN
ncbi:hypothetical protein GCM10010954_24270 [Halobacillus andaensis]|uniref:histidine kinase n=1 Tax=Halobacillus andaensis TaxID=1176239 RepID=A0A917B5Z1_HALAA|nr:histidine kinase [Halobacillus andaensis]MBP2005984.1 two-component system nitrate/nitrite sensor histidine kinase NarQ [Halobacillus andaensis]GGF24523.1 hypothetical protein GCM10010954_24270 [Halobacillus andaensis]